MHLPEQGREQADVTSLQTLRLRGAPTQPSCCGRSPLHLGPLPTGVSLESLSEPSRPIRGGYSHGLPWAGWDCTTSQPVPR